MLVHNTLSNLQHVFLWVCDSTQGYEYIAPLSLQHGQTSVSSSGEMHMPFTAEVPLLGVHLAFQFLLLQSEDDSRETDSSGK